MDLTNKGLSDATNAVLCVLKSQPDRVWLLEDVEREITHKDKTWAATSLNTLTETGWLEMRRGKKYTWRRYYKLTEAGQKTDMWFPDRDFPTSTTAP